MEENVQIITQLSNIAQQIGRQTQVLAGRFSGGTVTLSAATTTIVGNSAVQGNSNIVLTPQNGTAALLQRTQGIYISTQTANSGFVISTQTGVPAGTERFAYIVFTPT